VPGRSANTGVCYRSASDKTAWLYATNNGKYVTGLAKVNGHGSVLELILDFNEHTIEFRVNNKLQGGIVNMTTAGVDNKPLYPFVAILSPNTKVKIGITVADIASSSLKPSQGKQMEVKDIELSFPTELSSQPIAKVSQPK
jgi:hypothetical protein